MFYFKKLLYLSYEMIVFFLFIYAILPPKIDGLTTVVIPSGDGFVFIKPDSIYTTKDGIEFESRIHQFQESFYRMQVVPDQLNVDNYYLVSHGGGIVMEYNSTNDTVIRIDNSYRFLNRFGESLIALKDTVFSFGGYGEFSYNNKFISFRKDFREWNIVPIEEEIIRPRKAALIQYDTVSHSFYIAGGRSSHFKTGVESLAMYYEIFKISPDRKVNETGTLRRIRQKYQDNLRNVLMFKPFLLYRIPILYSNQSIWAFDLIQNKAFEFVSFDKNRLQQYTEIISYNPKSHKFLIGTDIATEKPRYNVVNELDLLGLEYIEHDLSLKGNRIWLSYGIVGLMIIILTALFKKSSEFVLIDVILKNEKRIQQKLSSEDFFILRIILNAYPASVEYPELQNSYQKELSYESRIKKLRTSINEIDTIVKETIKLRRGSIFLIEKGLDDKRVKVIKIDNRIFKRRVLSSRLFSK